MESEEEVLGPDKEGKVTLRALLKVKSLGEMKRQP